MKLMSKITVFVVALGITLVLPPKAFADTTFVVNGVGDESDAAPGDGICDNGLGNCTLRAAIEEANTLPGRDTVTFNITSGDPLIQVSAELPAITDRILIDGTTQLGYVNRPLVRIDGAAGCSRCSGLALASNDSTIRGLSITSFEVGISISGENNVIEGNFIGVDRDGVTPQPNSTGVSDNGNKLSVSTTLACCPAISFLATIQLA